MRRYLKAQIKNGKFISDRDRFKQVIDSLPDGNYLHFLISITQKSVREWRAYYFVVLHQWSIDTGEDKMVLHGMVKDELFPELFGDKVTSTGDLNNEEWNVLMWNLNSYLILKYENK